MWYVQSVQIPIKREFTLDLPADAQFLGVMVETWKRSGFVQHIPYLYIRTFSRSSKVWRPKFLLLKTSEEAEDGFRYVGSFQHNREEFGEVYHLFREPDPPIEQPSHLAKTVT